MSRFFVTFAIAALLSVSASEAHWKPKTYANLAEALKGEGLTTLLSLIKQVPALLTAGTTGSTNVTLFAPTNDAFKAILPSIPPAAANLSDPSVLGSILGYHVVSAAVLPAAAATKAIKSTPARIVNLPTLLDGSTLTFTLTTSKGIVILAKGSAANVVRTDIKAGSSIVHIIDNVLLPLALPASN